MPLVGRCVNGRERSSLYHLFYLMRFFILLSLLTTLHAAPRKVVFILADDLGWGELGCYGQEKIRTPHLDQFAKEGMRFTQGHLWIRGDLFVNSL